MKMESMARYLIKGDIIIYNRRKFEVINAKNNGGLTTILYKYPKSSLLRTTIKPSNEFLKIISPISLKERTE